MSRRTGLTAIAVTLVVGGFVPALTGGAAATTSPGQSATQIGTPGEPVIAGTTPGCLDLKDGKGDAPISSTAGGNEPDLDITGAVFRTTADKFITYFLVDKLATRPSQAPGHTFYTDFTVNGKAVSIFAASYDPAAIGTARNTGASSGAPLAPTNQLRVGGSYQASAIVDAEFNTTKSLVTISLKRADLAKATGSTFESGTQLTLLKVRSGADFGGITPAGGDAAGGTATDVLAVDSNACFGPPPAVLAVTGAVTSQYGDAAQVAAKLTSSTGDALAGKSLTFGLAGKAVIATTDAAGVASASIPLSVTAGPQTLSIAFTGDATADKVSMTTPFTVVEEKTKLILAVTKTGTARTVVATLLDDDNKPVAGQKLLIAVNGKTVATLTTSSAGKVSYTKANPSQTVKVTFAPVTGKYVGTFAQIKL